MAEDELAGWLRLVRTPGLTPRAARALLASFGSPQAVWAASRSARTAVVGLAAADAIAADDETALRATLAATQAWLQASPAHRVLTLADADYPPLLLQIPDPPLLLFLRGDARWLAAPALAMVGSRSATAQGLATARDFGTHFARCGLAVVSGLALGIDGAAHEGALAGGGITVAVIGTGPEQDYPRRHVGLAARIAAQGVVVSEYPPGTPPLPANFPRRNRLIAGLSLGTLVVEAAVQSGSLITAKLATDFGREVFAIPGSIHAPQARGCHALIKTGAKLVETAQDVLDELRWAPAAMPAAGPAPAGPAATKAPRRQPDEEPADPILRALGHDPLALDELAARTGFGAPELAARLLDLELAGRVARLPGGLVQQVTRV